MEAITVVAGSQHEGLPNPLAVACSDCGAPCWLTGNLTDRYRRGEVGAVICGDCFFRRDVPLEEVGVTPETVVEVKAWLSRN